MAFINVTLRIVGLYFNETVSVDDAANPTVRDVLDAYIDKNRNLAVPGGLEYSRFPIDDNDFATTFTYHFPGLYNFNPDGVLTPPIDGTSLGKQTRPAGIYTLSENLEDQLNDKKVGLVWQYYVTDLDGKPKSKTPVSRGFAPFGSPLPPLPPIPPLLVGTPQFLVAGDVIIWRLVAIARRPNFLPAVLMP